MAAVVMNHAGEKLVNQDAVRFSLLLQDIEISLLEYKLYRYI